MVAQVLIALGLVARKLARFLSASTYGKKIGPMDRSVRSEPVDWTVLRRRVLRMEVLYLRGATIG